MQQDSTPGLMSRNQSPRHRAEPSFARESPTSFEANTVSHDACSFVGVVGRSSQAPSVGLGHRPARSIYSSFQVCTSFVFELKSP